MGFVWSLKHNHVNHDAYTAVIAKPDDLGVQPK